MGRACARCGGVMLTFSRFRDANRARQVEWPGNDQADIPYRTIEVAGECGELCEAMKKYLRSERGIAGSRGTITEVANEMADCVIAIDLLANAMGVDLEDAIRRKFNKTSHKYGLKTTI